MKNLEKKKAGRQSAPLGFKLAAVHILFWSFDHNLMLKEQCTLKVVFFFFAVNVFGT